MNNIAVIGLQWGDEGKGKIVDYLSENTDIIVRFQGGNNAGHTIVIEDKTYKLSLIPSGIVRKNKLVIIGGGVVIDPRFLLKEMQDLHKQDVDISPDNLMIADNAVIIFDFYKELEEILEKQKGESMIGTTKRGIGPAYEDKVGRRAIRMCDLIDGDILQDRVRLLVLYHNLIRKAVGANLLNEKQVFEDLVETTKPILPFIKSTWQILEQAQKQGKKILFEGAQGFMLDNDYGTYPFVTASNTITAQLFIGAGVSNKSINHVIGVAKAYTTRVGSGPFFIGAEEGIADKLQQIGKEFGTVTGRKRKCGWFDAVAISQSCKLCSVDTVALTKLDVLDNLSTLKICVAYEYDGKRYDYIPSSIHKQQKLQPIYEEMEGWQENTYNITNINDLPKNAIKYIQRIEKLIDRKISMISTSPERNGVINLLNL